MLTPRFRAALYHRVAPRADFQGRAFAVRFWPFFLAQTLVAPLPLLLFLVMGPAQLRGALLALLLVKIGFGGVISATLVSRFFPIWISPTRLRVRTLLGLAFVVRWDEIEAVYPIRWLFFMPSLVLKTRFGLLWIPRYLVQQREFETLLRAWVPPETTLGRFLEKEQKRQ